jgi:TPR repeat protein
MLLQCHASPASADWLLSSDTKVLIARAEAGDSDAQLRVGAAYDRGKGAPHDRAIALKWYRMAADAGNAEAQNSVGSMLQEDGKYTEALSWYEKAAAQGHAEATNSEAYLHDLGLGVPQDRKLGFDLYSRAADLGFAEAMWNLANMYGAGQVGPANLQMACVWAYRAMRFAGPNDKRLTAHLVNTLPQFESRLGTEKLASCREQADSWTPSPGKH